MSAPPSDPPSDPSREPYQRFHADFRRAALTLWVIGAPLIALSAPLSAPPSAQGETTSAPLTHALAFTLALALTWLDLWALSAGARVLVGGGGRAGGLITLKILGVIPLLSLLVLSFPRSLYALLLGSSVWVPALIYAGLRDARRAAGADRT